MTVLLQRITLADPIRALYAAAEIEFWWGRPRSTDNLGQLFWFDDAGEPVAAAAFIDFNTSSSLLYEEVIFCPFTLPNATAEQIGHVLDRGLAHASELGLSAVELEVERSDTEMQARLAERGFTRKTEHVLVECRLAAEACPEVSPLADGYRLATRADTQGTPHHMTGSTPDFEQRLQQGSLYRSDLDLVVLANDDSVAAQGIFWFDPVTRTGVVEPMRTHDDHQQRGLARHVLTAGVNKLVAAGAELISIGYDPDNPASGHLYRSVGFEPTLEMDLYSGPTQP